MITESSELTHIFQEMQSFLFICSCKMRNISEMYEVLEKHHLTYLTFLNLWVEHESWRQKKY